MPGSSHSGYVSVEVGRESTPLQQARGALTELQTGPHAPEVHPKAYARRLLIRGPKVGECSRGVAARQGAGLFVVRASEVLDRAPHCRRNSKNFLLLKTVGSMSPTSFYRPANSRFL